MHYLIYLLVNLLIYIFNLLVYFLHIRPDTPKAST